jgi:serine/threonine-protein kinase
MPFDSNAALLEALRSLPLLAPAQLAEVTERLAPRFRQPRRLAQELLRRGWITPYQVNQLFLGKGNDLVVGPYLILERLGEGGLGQVFKAWHSYMQRHVTIKLIRGERVEDAEAVARFYREIQVVSQLAHPNVIQAYDAGPIGASHFIALEYVEGTDLHTRVRQGELLPVPQACDYVRQAALGLQHLHERGLVHRDVRPANLLVLPIDGLHQSPGRTGLTQFFSGKSYPWGLVKIVDVGLARFQAGDNGLAGGLRGSADFLAPEQAADFHSADIRADIYSLGCTFYFLLTGQAPFEGGTAARKLFCHQRLEPTPIDRLRSGLPRRLVPVIRKMMAKRPGDRYQTPAEVAAAITAVHDRSWLPIWR